MRMAAIAGLSLLSVAAHGQVPERQPCTVAWSDGASSCSWEVIELEEVFRTRVVEGTLANQGGELWPDGVDVVLELASAADHSLRYAAHALTPSGQFTVKDVPPGEYCFRVGVRPAGWSCVQGHG